MKKWLEKQAVFNFTLRILAFLAKRKRFDRLTEKATSQSAQLNLLLNKPKPAKDAADLAQTWLDLMPPDGQQHFKIEKVTEDTAYTQIHLHCPLRGSGNAHACHKLMNYDRKLMEQVGGQLIVLESQSNSGKPYCRLAIRKAGEEVQDLIPAHER